ncbi:MAG: hypothetical protein F7C07_03495 [Desulfurococcales archaeon]|nr:hypothetical protein [Desulfurococcales archaeon]
MGLQDLQAAFNSLAEVVKLPVGDWGYAISLAGVVLVTVLLGGLLIVGIYRGLKSLFNMTPSGFLKTIAVMAGVFIIAGLLLP